MNIKKIIGDIPKKGLIYILGAVGVLLLILPSFIPKHKEEAVSEPEVNYCEEVEKKLEEILPRIAGVGEVSVMVTAKNYGELHLAKDNSEDDEKTVILNQKGGGENTQVVEELYPQIQGVIVAADGGGSSKIKEAVTEAIEALLGVDAHKIKVFERKIDE